MRESEATRTSFRISRHRTLIAALAVILVGGAAFAAAGGVEAVKEIFVNVTIRLMGPDGESYEVVKLQSLDVENGEASATLSIGEGQMATMVLDHVSGTDLTDEPGVVQGEFLATITIDGAAAPDGDIGAERTIELSMTANAGETVDQEGVVEQIADAEVVVPWVDAAGEARELYIVRRATETEPVLKMFSSRWLDSGEEVYDMVGLLSGVITDEAEITGVEVDENGLATMTLLLEDGEEKRVAFNADPGGAEILNESLERTVITISHEDE